MNATKNRHVGISHHFCCWYIINVVISSVIQQILEVLDGYGKHGAHKLHRQRLFYYWPLNQGKYEIRLLRVQTEPAAATAEVSPYLAYASLLDPRVPHAYSCLSYCWGDTSNTKEISVIQPERCLRDGTYQGKTFKFRVTADLEAALQKIRSLTARPLVWADAVCINQSDLVERAQQVSIMHKIYSMSMQTLIWLGDADAESNAAMDFVIHIRSVVANAEHLNMNSFKAGIRCSRLRGLLKGELTFTKQEVYHPDFRAMLLAVRSLLRLPWFRRVRVLQQVSRSSSVVAISGHKACQWEDVRNLGVWENRVTLWDGDIPWADQQQPLPNVDISTTPDTERTDDLLEIWWFLARECKEGHLPSVSELVYLPTENNRELHPLKPFQPNVSFTASKDPIREP
jgi:hypothetical protein